MGCVVFSGAHDFFADKQEMFLGFIPSSKTTQKPLKVASVNEIFEKKTDTTYLRPIILGSLDGIITSFVIIAGGLAGEVVKSGIMAIGFSSLFADAFSMGTSEYLSSRTESSIRRSFIHGISCFTSFFVFGIVPLLTFLFSQNMQLLACILSFVVCLIVIAFMQSYILQKFVIISLLEILFLGSVAGSIAYGVAYVTHEIA